MNSNHLTEDDFPPSLSHPPILRHIQISLKQMQIPVVQIKSGHASTYKAMLPKLMSAVTTHTHLFLTLKTGMEITFGLKPLRFLNSGLFLGFF